MTQANKKPRDIYQDVTDQMIALLEARGFALVVSLGSVRRMDLAGQSFHGFILSRCQYSFVVDGARATRVFVFALDDL